MHQSCCRVGYAACHWCHVMAHESFEDEDTAAYLNEHFVSVKVDREERPDVDAVYMQATTAMTGNGGWPMTCVLDHEGVPFFAGTYFPDQPRHGQPAFRQVLQALSEAWTSQPEEVQRVAGSIREHLRGAVVPAGRSRSTRRCSTRRWRRSARSSTPRTAGSAPRPSSRRSMVAASACWPLRRSTGSDRRCASGMLDRTLDAMARVASTTSSPAASPATASTAAGWSRTSRRCSTTTPSWSASTRAAVATSADRVARETADFLLAELGTAEGAFASALDADSPDASGHSREGAYYAWTPAELDAVLGDDAAWAARLLDGHRRRHVRGGCVHAPAPRRPGRRRALGVRAAAAARRAQRACPAGPRRQGGRGVERARGLRTGRRRAAPRRARVRRGGGPLRVVPLGRALGPFDRLRAVDGRLRRVSRDGVVGAHAGVLEDYGCLATAYVDLAAATADPVWLERARTLLDVAVAQFAAGDGGFFDTADDAEALVSRPRDPADNASPSGLSSLAHALLGYAALTGSGEHRSLAEQALTSVVEIARKAPRFAGWSLAAAEAALSGPVEIAVVGADDDPARAELARSPARRACRGRSWWWPHRASPASRCSRDATWSTGAPRRTSAATWSASGR